MNDHEKQQICTEILACIQDGEKRTQEILQAVSGTEKAKRAVLREMKGAGQIREVKRGTYAKIIIQNEPADGRRKSKNHESCAECLRCGFWIGYWLQMRI